MAPGFVVPILAKDNKLSDNDLQQGHSMAPGADVQEAANLPLQTGRLDPAIYEEIVGSFRHLGSLNRSKAAAMVYILRAFAHSKKVRRVVLNALPEVIAAETGNHREEEGAA